MSTHTRYLTASGSTPEALDQEVARRLKEGLQLYGDPYAASGGAGTLLCQALVGTEPETMAEQLERAQVVELPASGLPVVALER